MDTQRHTYKAAYEDAAAELKKIQDEFERLSIRREKLAKVMEALQPRVGAGAEQQPEGYTLTTRLDTATVITRVAVTYSGSAE